jgi:hypothetical protein
MIYPMCVPYLNKDWYIYIIRNGVRIRRRYSIYLAESKIIHRKLRRNETVHHKDFNHYNNELSNLQVLTRSEHQYIHANTPKSIQNLSARMKQYWKTIPSKQRSAIMKQRAASLTPEQRSEIAQIRAAQKTPEQRSESAILANSVRGPDKRSQIIKKGWITRRLKYGSSGRS